MEDPYLENENSRITWNPIFRDVQEERWAQANRPWNHSNANPEDGSISIQNNGVPHVYPSGRYNGSQYSTHNYLAYGMKLLRDS